jgi:hypothetical protein
MGTSQQITILAIEDCGNHQYIIYFSNETHRRMTSVVLTNALKNRERLPVALPIAEPERNNLWARSYEPISILQEA